MSDEVSRETPQEISVGIEADSTGVVTIYINPPSGILCMPAINAMLMARDLMKAATMANNEIRGKILIPTKH